MSEDDSLAPPKKSKLGLILGIVGGVLVLVAGAAAGLFLGPSLFGGPATAAASAPPAAHAPQAPAPVNATPKAPPTAPEKIISAAFDPLIVDVMDSDGMAHHLKVGLSAELADGVTVEEFKLLMPRGREAAITYLRSLSFEDVTSPKKYAKLKKELTRNVTKAIGENKLHRLLIVDFVAQ